MQAEEQHTREAEARLAGLSSSMQHRLLHLASEAGSAALSAF